MSFFLLVLLALQQPVIITAELGGVDACQNRCFNQSECKEVGNGHCCEWDDSSSVGQCISRIGDDICPRTATMVPHLPSTPPIACPPKAMKNMMAEEEETHITTVSEIEAESAPSSSPTYYGYGCSHAETWREWHLCMRDMYYDGYRCSHAETWREWHLCMGYRKDVAALTNIIITAKISSGLSILGSIYIVQDVLRDPKKLKESTYHRIMVGLSCSDIIFSFVLFLGSWVVPRYEILFAVGNVPTCSVAGFFLTLSGACTPLNNCSLATFFLLKLKFNWVNRKIKAIEKWLLFVPCIVGLILAGAATIVEERFGTSLLGGIYCGSESIGRIAIGNALINLFGLGFVSITMFQVYRSVRSVEKGAQKYTFARYISSQQNTSSMSRRVMLQGVLYSAVLLSMTFMCFVCVTLILVFDDLGKWGYVFAILLTIFVPLQGFFNALIYMIPLFRRMMEKRRNNKAKQNMSRSIQDQQRTSKTWLTRWNMSWTKLLTSKKSKNNKKKNCIGQIEQVEGECKEGEVLSARNDNSRVEGLKLKSLPGGLDEVNVNSKKQEKHQMLDLKALSESNGRKSEREMIEDDTKIVGTTSSLMLSCVEEEEEVAFKPSSFALSHPNSPLNDIQEEQSHLDYFSALEANTETYNNVEDEDNESDEESYYIDDYLKMMMEDD